MDASFTKDVQGFYLDFGPTKQKDMERALALIPDQVSSVIIQKRTWQSHDLDLEQAWAWEKW